MSANNIRVLACTEPGLVSEIAYLPTDHHKITLRATALARYLLSPEIQAGTIVVELNYTDKDYLEDYAGFYVSCFHDYERKCRRLHFFKNSFDESAFNALTEGPSGTLTPEILQENYLGFVVLRPLPEARIGRTCIATYTNAGERHFPAIVPCSANLCGIDLTVDSVPYQEQDTVTAACATSAIWSALHVTAKRFHHQTPSPVTITQWAASAGVGRDNRTLPNHGLDIQEIICAIRRAGLEPLTLNLGELENSGKAVAAKLLREVVRAYSGAKLPIILGMGIHREKDLALLDHHAVTVCGYGMAHPSSTPSKIDNHYSSRINKLFVHDDQVVPFARTLFGSVAVPQKNGPPLPCEVLRETPDYAGHFLNPTVVVVPLHHKIRIPYLIAKKAAIETQTCLDRAVKSLSGLAARDQSASNFLSAVKDVEWDIQLFCGTDYKKEMLAATDISDKRGKRFFVSRNSPRFLWRVSLRSGTVLICDILLDATDFERGNLAFDVVHRAPHSTSLFQVLKSSNQILNLPLVQQARLAFSIIQAATA